MIAALGCKYVILGHSERRQYYGETSETLNRKMEQAYANDLVPIYCVGENLDEREAGKHFDVVKAQIEEVVYNLTTGTVRQAGHRLRTRMGHRHGQDRDGRAGAGDPRLHPQGAGRQIRRGSRGVPDPLRRVVQTVQRSRDLRQGGRRRRSDRRRSRLRDRKAPVVRPNRQATALPANKQPMPGQKAGFTARPGIRTKRDAPDGASLF